MDFILEINKTIGEVSAFQAVSTALTTAAFQQGFTGGQYIVSVGLTLFAFTTILGWSYYGEKCTEYLLIVLKAFLCIYSNWC